MSVKAISKSVRISPRKVSVVAALVRNRTVNDALTILQYAPRRGSDAVAKTIKSAKANAEHNFNMKPDSLKIIEISVTQGPSLKRYRPVSHGRAHPFLKRSSHIRVVVDGQVREIKKSPVKTSAKPVKKSSEKEETK